MLVVTHDANERDSEINVGTFEHFPWVNIFIEEVAQAELGAHPFCESVSGRTELTCLFCSCVDF